MTNSPKEPIRCNSTTHHLGCACHEARHAAEIERLEALAHGAPVEQINAALDTVLSPGVRALGSPGSAMRRAWDIGMGYAAAIRERDDSRDELEALRARWFGLRAHITRIADAGARNDERQKVFEELRDIIVRLEGAE